MQASVTVGPPEHGVRAHLAPRAHTSQIGLPFDPGARQAIVGVIRPGRQHMATPPVRFNDGGAYERGMGRWSRLVGEVFLDWLAPPKGARWIDVGCGSGAFTELL